MQFAERRLPTLAELDAVNRPVYIQAAQGGARTNTAGKAWFEARGVTVAADGAIAGPALPPRSARAAQGTADARNPQALAPLTPCNTTPSSASPPIATAAPSTPKRSPAALPMRTPTRCTTRFSRCTAKARCRPACASTSCIRIRPPPIRRCPRSRNASRNSFPFFGDEWIKTGGIGEFTGGGIEGLRAIAKAGWRAEDHALNLAGVTKLIKDRETVNAETPLNRPALDHLPHPRLPARSRQSHGRHGHGRARRLGTPAQPPRQRTAASLSARPTAC